MNAKPDRKFPRLIFAVISIGALIASGIFLGIMTVEGYSTIRLVSALGFAGLGLVLFWGVYTGS